MKKHMRKSGLIAAAVASVMGAQFAQAITWNGSDSVNSVDWSDGLNWVNGIAPSAATDTVTFDSTGVANLSNNLGGNLTLAQLSYRLDDTTKIYATTIGRGTTLTLTGTVTPSTSLAQTTDSSFIVMPANTATNSGRTGITVAISSATTGSGTLGALKITKGNFMVTGRPGTASTNDSYAILDLSGLDSFTYAQTTNSVFAVGQGNTTNGGGTDNNAYWGKLILGNTTSITSNRVVVGGQNNAGTQGQQPVSTLLLGQTNNINTTLAGNEYIGGEAAPSKDGSGAMMFRGGLINPVLNIGDNASNRNGLEISRGRFATGHGQYGVLDLTSASAGSDGSFNGYFATVTVGAEQSGTSGASGGYALLSFDKGLLDATAIVIARTTSSPSAGSPEAGYLNVGVKGNVTDAGAGTVNVSSTITVGQRTDTSTGTPITAAINIANLGSVTADRIFLSNNTQATGTNSPVTGMVNLGGGSLTTSQIHAGSDVVQAGTSIRLVNFNGGTLKAKTGTTLGATFMEGLTGAYIYSGGGTIDTNSQDITINQPLLAPTGSGITSIDVTNAGGGYRAAPVILISGGGGTGAAALAQIDNNGSITGITVTNPGVGYTSAPTIQLVANGGTSFANQLIPYGGTVAALTANLTANVGGGLTKAGDGRLILTANNTYTGGTTIAGGTLSITSASKIGTGGLTIQSGGTLELPAGLTGAFVQPTSTINNGKIELNNNSMIVNYTGTSPVSDIRAQLQAGYAPGDWSGTSGITSAVAHADATLHHTLGYAEATQIGMTSLAGTNIPGTAVVVKFTYPGDSNLDGKVDLDNDFSLFVDGYNKQLTNPSLLNAGNLWVSGDYNYDGVVDLDNDFSIFVASYAAYQQDPTQLAQLNSIINSMDLTAAQKNALFSVVPEPASMGLLALGAGMLGMRRRRKA